MKTIISDDIGQYKDGYMSNISIAGEAAAAVQTIQRAVVNELGSSVWVQPLESLHITLFDFVAPRAKYDITHKKLYQLQASHINEVMTQLASEYRPFEIYLALVKSSAGAIYLEGHDDGSIASIRNRFLDLFSLDARTKRPPQIIHSTIARFTEQINLDVVKAAAEREVTGIVVPVNTLRLVHEQRIPMLQYEVLQEYLLQ